TYTYFALWVGMAFNIPSYLLASGLIDRGMSALQAFLTITIGNLVVLVPMLLNSHAGTKYGIPFPVFARAFFGIRGANLAALLRAFIACGWFGIQTWFGGLAIYVIVAKLAGDGWVSAAVIGGQPWTMWLSFAAFWVLQMLIIWRGMEAIRWLENWAAPLMAAGFLALAIYVVGEAGGVGPILSQPSQVGWGGEFWELFFPSLMGMIAFWATLSLNMPDFTRFAASQRKQAIGQTLGLPTTMSFIAIMSILITGGTTVIYGEAIWDPVTLVSQFDSVIAVVFGLLIVMVATISTNLAANVVSPSYDFSNAFPRRVSFAVGGLITGVLGIAVMPWRLVADPEIYIDGWLGFYGGVLAAVAGVLIAGYWFQARTRLDLAELYRREGRYWYTGGWNWRAVVAFVVGAVLAVGGANGGPFPDDGMIPALSGLYSYSWAVGLASAMIVYLVLTLPGERARTVRPPPAPEAATGTATEAVGR
ncbi:MAG: NCS1 family nucleobase:cation symporter-1, partial [Thermocrispum sp.]